MPKLLIKHTMFFTRSKILRSESKIENLCFQLFNLFFKYNNRLICGFHVNDTYWKRIYFIDVEYDKPSELFDNNINENDRLILLLNLLFVDFGVDEFYGRSRSFQWGPCIMY